MVDLCNIYCSLATQCRFVGLHGEVWLRDAGLLCIACLPECGPLSGLFASHVRVWGVRGRGTIGG